MNLSKVLVFVSAFAVPALMTGCASKSGTMHGPAYQPVPDLQVEVKERGGSVSSFTFRAHDMGTMHLKAAEAEIAALKKRCVKGVEREERRDGHRPNPYVSRYSRSFLAAAHGVVEQPVLFHIDLRVECRK